MVEFAANGATAQGYLSLPASPGGPGLVLLQEWWGLVDHIKVLADRCAAAGFVTLAPDLYHGASTAHPDEAGKLLMSLNMAETAAELRGAADYVLQQPLNTTGKVGALGFCMGGQLALYAATAHPDRVHAVVDFYGIFNPRVPVDISALQAPVQAHFGRTDESIPLDKVDALMAEIARTGVVHEHFVYEAGHAFFNDTRPTAYDAESATLAWDRAIGFLHEHLA